MLSFYYFWLVWYCCELIKKRIPFKNSVYFGANTNMYIEWVHVVYNLLDTKHYNKWSPVGVVRAQTIIIAKVLNTLHCFYFFLSLVYGKSFVMVIWNKNKNKNFWIKTQWEIEKKEDANEKPFHELSIWKGWEREISCICVGKQQNVRILFFV